MSTDLILSLFFSGNSGTLRDTQHNKKKTNMHCMYNTLNEAMFCIKFRSFFFIGFDGLKSIFILDLWKRRKKAHAVVAEFYFIPHSLVFSQGE